MPSPVPPLIAPADLQIALTRGAVQPTLDLCTQLADDASRAARRHCGRMFTRATYDERYTLLGIDQPLVLNQFPVVGDCSIRSNPTTALRISNGDAATNQRATVSYTRTGDRDSGIVTTGVRLARRASGVAIVADLAFEAYPTIGQLAAAIDALGGGWSADPGEFAAWGVDELDGEQGTCPALQADAQLVVFADDLTINLDRDAAIVHIDRSADSPFNSIRFGPFLATALDDPRLFGATNGIRAVYEAGYDQAPADVAEAVVLIARQALQNRARDFTLSGERWEDYERRFLAWADQDVAIPLPAQQRLAPWRNRRA